MLGAGLDVQGGITSVEKLILEHAPPELKIYHVATFAKGSAFHNVRVFLRAAKTLVQTLLRGEADLVHIHFSERGSTLRKAILILITLGFRKPLVLHAHGATYEEFYAGLPPLVQNLINLVFRQCTKFIALSEGWKTFYAENFHLKPNQIAVLHNPVKLPSESPHRVERQQVTFVFLGRIGKRGGALDQVKSVIAFPKQDKGAFDLIRAFAALPEQERTRAKLVLAGNGDVEMAQQLIQELGIEQRATVYSWLSPEQRDELLVEADAFVLPSYNEGLPMSMLEAMGWGLPHNQNGLLVTPGNQEEIAQAMQNLIKDESLRLTLGTAARNRVQYLDIKNYINSLMELYTSVTRQDKRLVNQPSMMQSNS
jgi:glycosyltransferase involved in cell wall biosynthesis